MVVAHHIILTGYGHWLPNDPRGSLSTGVRSSPLQSLGPIHYGRRAVQPARDDLKRFQRRAEPLLAFTPLWFDPAKRQAIAEAFAEVVRVNRYTCYACAIMANHAHLVVRRHRDRAEQIIAAMVGLSKSRIRSAFEDVPPGHPIWSDDPFKKFLDSPEGVTRTIRYVEANPQKSNLPAQRYAFCTPYRFEWFGGVK